MIKFINKKINYFFLISLIYIQFNSLNIIQAQTTLYEDYASFDRSIITPFLGMIIGAIDIPVDTRENIMKGFIHGILTSLRSNGIDITYEKLNFEKDKDQFQFKKIILVKNVDDTICNKKLFSERGIYLEGANNEFTFIPKEQTSDLNYWDNPCKLTINIDELIIKGLGVNKKINNTGLELKNLVINLKAFNSSEYLSIKLASGIKDEIKGDLDINYFYEINKNISKIFFEIKFNKLFSIDSGIELRNITYNKITNTDTYENNPSLEGYINSFDFRLVNYGLITSLENLNALDSNSSSLSNNLLINLPPLTKDLDIVYPLNNSKIDSIVEFIENGKTLECIRRNPHPINQRVLSNMNSTLLLSVLCENISVNTNYLDKKIKNNESGILNIINDNRKAIKKLREKKIKLFLQGHSQRLKYFEGGQENHLHQ